jgi:DnaJ-domain-containing protein 1
VEGFIDRLAQVLRSLFGNEEGNFEGSAVGRPSIDPDLRAAWEELDEYMRTGAGGFAGKPGGHRAKESHPPDESLRQDYANLEVPFGADIETVRASYRRLMLMYHPDRYAGDLEKQKLALEIAKKINQSFERIKSHQEGPA